MVLITCPECKRDITSTSQYCPYCGPLNSNGSTDSEEAAADWGSSFMEGLDGCSESIKGCSGNLFQFGCAFTLLMALLAILFFLIFG